MRITIFLVAALFAAVCAASGEMDVYLLMGQSNMAGRGALAAEDRAAPEGIVKLDASGKWVPASEPIHFDKPVAGAGLAASFAKRVARPGVAVGLVPCAVGGTPLARWMPGADLYKAAVARAKIAQKSGTIRAILWHQGEGDCAEGKCEIHRRQRRHTQLREARRELPRGFREGTYAEWRQPPLQHEVAARIRRTVRRGLPRRAFRRAPANAIFRRAFGG